jgi:small subunit ribosomal protein S4
MKIGPKYKIARRLGAPIFEKTQGPKYALSLARKEKVRTKGRVKPKSEFGLQLIEKQKTRLTYGLTEKQFRSYVDKSLGTARPVEKLFSLLESRLDNVLYRAGFARTRQQARQAASHGHVVVNGRKVTIPSIILKEKDVVGLRAGSAGSALFADVAERMKTTTVPNWLTVDPVKRSAEVVGKPEYNPAENLFDLGVVIEFYNR